MESHIILRIKVPVVEFIAIFSVHEEGLHSTRQSLYILSFVVHKSFFLFIVEFQVIQMKTPLVEFTTIFSVHEMG